MRKTITAFLLATTLVSPAFAQAPTAKPAPKPAASAAPKPAAPTAPKPAAPAAPKPAAPAAPKPAAAPAAPKPAAAPAAPAAAPPKPKPPAKADSFTLGETKFKANDFAGALVEFKAVNLGELPKETAQKRAPLLAYYTAVCEDKTAGYRDAALHYEQFLAMNPKNMSKEADDAKKRVDAIKAMGGHLKFTANAPGAELSVDDRVVGAAPIEVDLPQGKHRVKMTAPGREPFTAEVDVAYASNAAVNVELAESPPAPAAVAVVPATPVVPPTPPAQPAEPPKEESRSKLPAYITGGVAIVALGLGTAFGIKALGHQSDYDKAPTEDNANSGENSALIADMAFGVAITFGITSAVLFFTSDAPAAKPAGKLPGAKTAKSAPIRIIPTPIITTHGGGAGAMFRF